MSDIHGKNNAMRKLRAFANADCKNQFIILGDMIDRGPDSARDVNICMCMQGLTQIMSKHPSDK
jgi:predicted phosphodiesterase